MLCMVSSFSPVPEAVFREETPGFKNIELQQDLQQVESQEKPFWVRDQWILLIETDEHSVHQDD